MGTWVVLLRPRPLLAWLLQVLACLSSLRITNVHGRERAKEFICLSTIREGIKRTGIVAVFTYLDHFAKFVFPRSSCSLQMGNPVSPNFKSCGVV